MALYGIGVAYTTPNAVISSYCLTCAGKFVTQKPLTSFIVLSMLGNERLMPTKGYARQPTFMLDREIVDAT